MTTRSMFRPILLCLSLFIHTSFAWGTLGHEMIGNLAWHRLSPTAKSWVQEILHVVDASGDDDNSPLGKVADWADQVRHWMGWSSPLHFIDIRDDQIGGCYSNKDGCHFQYERDCPNDVCVAGAILNYTQQLYQTDLSPSSSSSRSSYALRGSPRSTVFNVTQSLMFLTHFVGDIHQPLHVSRTSDKGGNDFHVHFSLFNGASSHHHSWNLHSVWDSGIIEVVLQRNYNNSRQLMEEDLYRHSLDESENTDNDCSFGGLKACVILWAEESWNYALNYAYVLSDNVTQVENGSTLDELYYESRLPIVQEQLVKAGIRLAKTLEIASGQHGIGTLKSL